MGWDIVKTQRYKIGYLLGQFSRSEGKCKYFRNYQGWLIRKDHATIFIKPQEAEIQRRRLKKRQPNKIMFLAKCYYTDAPLNHGCYDHFDYKQRCFYQLTRINPLQMYDSLIHKI